MTGVQLQRLDHSLFGVETLRFVPDDSNLLSLSMSFAVKLGVDTGLYRSANQQTGSWSLTFGRSLRYEWRDSERVTFENDGLLLGSITTLHTLKKNRGPWTPLVLHTLFYIFLQPMITHLESAWSYTVLPLFNTSATSDWLTVRSLFCQAMVELCKLLAPSMKKTTITRPTDMPKANLANLATKRRWDGLNRPYQKGASIAASKKAGRRVAISSNDQAVPNSTNYKKKWPAFIRQVFHAGGSASSKPFVLSEQWKNLGFLGYEGSFPIVIGFMKYPPWFHGSVPQFLTHPKVQVPERNGGVAPSPESLWGSE